EDVVLVVAIEALSIGNAVDVEVEMRAAGCAIVGRGVAQSRTADNHSADNACYYHQHQEQLPDKTPHRPLLPLLLTGPSPAPSNQYKYSGRAHLPPQPTGKTGCCWCCYACAGK